MAHSFAAPSLSEQTISARGSGSWWTGKEAWRAETCTIQFKLFCGNVNSTKIRSFEMSI